MRYSERNLEDDMSEHACVPCCSYAAQARQRHSAAVNSSNLPVHIVISKPSLDEICCAAMVLLMSLSVISAERSITELAFACTTVLAVALQ
jgi:hypothetical protein